MRFIDSVSTGLVAPSVRFHSTHKLLTIQSQSFGHTYSLVSGGKVEQSYSYKIDENLNEFGCFCMLSGSELFVTSGEGLPLQLRDAGNGDIVRLLGFHSADYLLKTPNPTTAEWVQSRLGTHEAGFSEIYSIGKYLFAHVTWADLVEVYDLSNLSLRTSLPMAMMNFHLHPEGRLVACNLVGDAQMPIFFLDIKTMWPYRAQFDPLCLVKTMVFRPQGDLLAVLLFDRRNCYLCGYDFPSFSLRYCVKDEISSDHKNVYSSRRIVDQICFFPDGETLLYACQNGSVSFLDASNGHILNNVTCHNHPITSMDLRCDPSILATAGIDGVVKLWSIDSDKPLASPTTGISDSFVATTDVMPLQYDSCDFQTQEIKVSEAL